MKRNTFWNIVWGLLFIAAAGLIVLHLFGMLGELNTWTLVVSIPLAIGAIASAINMMWTGMFALLAVLAYIHWNFIGNAYGIDRPGVWAFIGIAAFLSIGFHLLFRKPGRWKHNKWEQGGVQIGSIHISDDNPTVEEADGEKLFFSEKFTGASKYIKSDNLSYVSIDNSFGGMEVYFENATLAPEGAVVDINNSFGGVEIHIPRTWNIVNKISNVFGMSEAPRTANTEGAPTITLRGTNKFGGVEINLV